MPFPALHRTRWLVAPVLGGVATLGFAPFGYWYLTLLALSLLFSLAARAAAGRAALLGWLFGFVHYATGVYWVYVSTHVYGGAPAWLSVGLAIALCAYLALYPALLLDVAVRLHWFRTPAGWAAVPALWVLLELVRGWFYSGFPWFSMGELSLDTPLARLLPLVGVHGVSAVFVLAAYALYRVGVEHDTRRRAWAAAAFAAPMLALLLPMPSSWTTSAGEPVTVALVQSNIRQDEKWKAPMRYEALVRHWRLTQQAWPADLVVWPEVALTQPYHQVQGGYLDNLRQQAAARNASILLGILVFEGETHYNSAIMVGASTGRYDKRHLVPFGEYFPIPDFLRPFMDAVGTPYKDFAFGAPQQAPLVAGGHRLSLSICFEDVFGSEVARDAKDAAYLVNITNDAWFAGTTAPYQHLQFSRLRAIENGRWMARVANTGITALIDPDGAIVGRTPAFEQQVLRGRLEPRAGMTPYQRWGNVPLWWGALLALGLAVAVPRVLARRTPTP